jgi:hypothetical protein
MFHLTVICEHVIEVHALNLNSKGFCWCCSTAGLTSILDFVHCFRFINIKRLNLSLYSGGSGVRGSYFVVPIVGETLFNRQMRVWSLPSHLKISLGLWNIVWYVNPRWWAMSKTLVKTSEFVFVCLKKIKNEGFIMLVLQSHLRSYFCSWIVVFLSQKEN